MIIGLTGGSGSGKTVAAQFFAKNGFFVLDYDKLTHQVYAKGEPCLDELTKHFGNDIIDSDGNLIRKKLGEIVFSDQSKLCSLNKIAMKHILKKSEIIIEEKSNKNILLDAPLLFEAGLDRICDATIAIIADSVTRIDRIKLRDGISEQTAKGRIASQHDDAFFEQNCDYCIYNNGSTKQLEASLEKLLEILYDNCQ